MNPNQTQPLAPVQPIHDVAPQTNSLGNPEQMGTIPVKQAPGTQPATAPTNPLMAAAGQPAPAAAAAKSEDLDKVLKEVNKDVKATGKKPSGPAKPIIVITIAVTAGLLLCAAAYYAFK